MKILLIGILIFLFSGSYGQCEMPKIKVEKSLGNYLYDNHAVAKIEKYERAYLRSFTFSMYGYPAYKFSFVLSNPDLKEHITIRVSELNKKKNTKTLVFSSKDSNEMEYLISDPKRTYIVEFIVSENSNLGCAAVALGYKMRHTGNETQVKKKKPRVKFK